MIKLITSSDDQTEILGVKFGERITKNIQVLMFGNLGAGKTQFIKGVCKGLGIDEIIKSPTYTLMQKYRSVDWDIYHYDLYRLSGNEFLDFMGIEEVCDNDKNLVFIEWADRLPKKYYPNERIDIHIKTLSKDTREIFIDFISEKTLSLEEVYELWDEFMCPLNIQNHMKQVGEVAKTVATKMVSKGEIVNIELVYISALLHDILRVLTIKTKYFDPHYTSAVTDKQLLFWESLRKKFIGKGHEEAGSELLRALGYPHISEIIKKHRFDYILDKNSFRNWEEKIVYYADKLVLHDKQVTLKERLEDSLIRHHGGVTTDKLKKLFELNYLLEKEIRNIID